MRPIGKRVVKKVARKSESLPASRARSPLAATASPVPASRDSIYTAIRGGILTGRYASGERLIETRLATEFGVSRTGIRDALARLQSDQLVSPTGKRGLIVRPPSAREIDEIYELRGVLECFAVRSAARNITARELKQLQDINDRIASVEASMENAGEPNRTGLVQTVTELNHQFHRIIWEASRNGRLAHILQHTLFSAPLVFRSFYWYSPHDLAASLADHLEIVDALANQDGDRAEATLRSHITRGRNILQRESFAS